ncbi:MAG: putative metal-binding motif-containing protein [Myxococcales bacterium]|nr:putative metal-binding motif-containing protein [Myxococcales bacterium]
MSRFSSLVWLAFVACGPPDVDADGFAAADDCDDNDAGVHPGADEVLCDGVDNDCNPSTPDVGDGDGDAVSCDVDCDDTDASAFPGAVEVCDDGVDNDCDATTPDRFDADGDGATCDVDCDDEDPSRTPGALELCDDDIDNDCSSLTPDVFDRDADGVPCTRDCNDDNEAEFPGNFEVCDDTFDNDCDVATADACVWFDDFEDGDLTGWTVESKNYTLEVDGIGAAGTSRSVLLDGGGTGHFDGISMDFEGLTPSAVTFWVRTASTKSFAGYVVLGGPKTGSNGVDNAVFLLLNSTGEIELIGEGVQSYVASAYSADVWYHVGLVLDWTEQEYDVHINGIERLTNIPFREDVTALHKLHLYNWWDASTHFDEISVFP